MKTTLALFAALLIVSNAHASSTQINNGVCTYVDDAGHKSPCTPEQQAAANQTLQNTLGGVHSIVGSIDPKLTQPSTQPVSAAPASFGGFDLSAFLKSYGLK